MATFPAAGPSFVGTYSALTADGIWNEWIEPLALCYDNRTWLGSVNSDGEVQVTVVSHEAGDISTQVLANIGDDDHNAPAICHGGAEYPVMAFFSNHATETKIYYVVSDAPDSTTFGAVQTLNMTDAVTYSQAFRVGSRVFLFCRQRPFWGMKYTDDNGDTWSDAVDVFGEDDWLYMIGKQDGNTLNVGVHQHPSNGSDQDIYHFQINLVTGNITKIGDATVLGNILTGDSLPVAWTSGLQVYNAGTGEATRLTTVGVNNDVVFSKWTNLANCAYQHASISAEGVVTVTELALAGQDLMAGNVIGYFGGISLDDDGNVYLSREKFGTWIIEKWVNDSGWRRDKTIIQSATKSFRPVPVKDAHTDLPVLWVAGTYTTYQDGYNTGVYPNEFTQTAPTFQAAGSPTFPVGSPTFV